MNVKNPPRIILADSRAIFLLCMSATNDILIKCLKKLLLVPSNVLGNDICGIFLITLDKPANNLLKKNFLGNALTALKSLNGACNY